MSRARARHRCVALASAMAVATTGCASVSETAQKQSLAALKTQDRKPIDDLPDLPASPACEKDPYRSVKPAVLPPPGHMPRGTYMRKIQDRGRLIVGVDQNSLGLGYYNPSSKRMEGFDIDMARKVAQAIFGGSGDPDRHIRYKAISTQQRPAAVFYRKVDLVSSAYSITCKRKRLMRFSSVYYTARQRLLVLDDSNIDSVDDLRGEKVCATTSSTTVERLEHVGAATYPVELRSDCLVALQERDVRAVSSDDTILFGMCQQDQQTKIVGPTVEGKNGIEHYGLAMDRRRAGFARFVNAVLARSDSEKLGKRWFGELPAASNREIRRCKPPGR